MIAQRTMGNVVPDNCGDVKNRTPLGSAGGIGADSIEHLFQPAKAQTKGARMSTNDTYLAVFTSNKTSPRWQGWYAMSEEERRAKDEVGLAALKAWDEKHRDAIVYMGGPLGPTKRTSRDGVADVVNELTIFVVVHAPSHEAAARMFESHPHFTIFPCDAVDVMPLLGPKSGA